MFGFDDKDLAILALMLIALAVLYFTKTEGLGVVSNIVCGLVGFVTGRAKPTSERGEKVEPKKVVKPEE